MLCAYMRPRYQVSVYRTIGPLVFIFFIFFAQNIDCGYGGSNVYSKSMFLSKSKKNIKYFHLKITIFTALKY